MIDGLAVQTHGSEFGPAVLLLHGFPDSAELWRGQVPVLVDAGYRVITVDLRGFGASDKPVAVEEYAPARVLGDVEAVLDGLGVDRAHVVGHDWGAVIAWVFASAKPDRVAGLVCLSTGHPASYRRAGREQREKGWYTLLFQFDVAEEWLLQDSAAQLRELLAGHPDMEQAVARLQQPGAMTAALGLYRAWAPPESLVGPRRPPAPVDVPAMGLWGTEDRFLTEQQMTGSAQEVRGTWRFERIVGAGHWLPLEATAAVNRLLLDFLARTTGDRPAEWRGR
ncbi:alpha/beta fold hydrolase [Streptacidiphilus griseoplanus]|uniref:alpha/beta fold hydrolase n=1 Tax=Peterkaempfera griseoplana TaxID=66896 RepID=UPI0006E37658|nr:alpha/beta fold hydrolase [Peterkaempfera griseoplana]